ncbi:MAG: DUF4097 family beta strand repeat protein [Leucobacter sp.]|nr:DUF4097 family beta strand repeat protein [Leucobacter sp.]
MTTSPPSSGRRGIAIATAVVGGVVLLGLGASAAFAMAASSQRADAQTAEASNLAPIDATGITGLDLNVGVADLRLEYGSVNEATLTATGGSADRWEFSRDGDELVLRAPKSNSGFCFFGVCPSTRGQHVTATLTLPQSFATQPLDADITVGVGSVRADGSFGELDVQVDAGDAHINGTATDLDLVIGMGTFEGEITGAGTVDAEVSLGDLALVLRGDPPRDVTLKVSAGSIDLAVPAGIYDVTHSRTSGSIDNELTMAAGAPNRISAKVDLGDITLSETR